MKRSKRRYLKLFLLVTGEILIILAVKIIWDYYSLVRTVPPEQFQVKLREAAGLDFYRNMYYIFISTVLWSGFNFDIFHKKTVEATLRSTLAEKANAELNFKFAQAQNAFLKQQINPHLLFNSLNAIYSTVYLNSPEDSKIVLLLSEIMHYSYLDPGPEGRVPLKNELVQLQNLAQLNYYRFGNAIALDLNVAGSPDSHKIIPLVLITLTENMFKHGDLRFTPRSLEITIGEKGHLKYISKNVPRAGNQVRSDTKIGLKNTRLRLDYAYPENYQLNITQTDELFILELNINLAYERNDH